MMIAVSTPNAACDARAAERTQGDRLNYGSSFPRSRGDANTDETVEHQQTTGINGRKIDADLSVAPP